MFSKKSLLLTFLGVASVFASNEVSYQYFDLDSPVEDIMWCGQGNESILILTEMGTVYRSRDRGSTWKRMQDTFEMKGLKQADKEQDLGYVTSILQSPVDDALVVFLGSSGINWVSEDCGAHVDALNSGKKIQEFLFHPTERNWGLVASWTTCEDFKNEPCRIYKELYATHDLGKSYIKLKDYVFDFAWGYTNQVEEKTLQHLMPKERVYLTHDPSSKGHQNESKSVWSNKVSLYYSDDYFSSQKLAVEGGNSLIKTDSYMFVAKAFQDQEQVLIYIASIDSGFTKFERATVPVEATMSRSFTVMDASESSAFLHIQNHGADVPMGNLYISDGTGRFYSLSIENVLRGVSFVDFERINSLEGVYIVNKYDVKHTHNFAQGEFDPERLEIDANAVSRMGAASGGNQNGKQSTARSSMSKTGLSKEENDLQKNIKTFITFNKGGKWEPIKAPEVNSLGKKITCQLEDGCSLHLQMYSSNGMLPPPYSQKSAVGIMLAVGNLGSQLSRTHPESQNTYLSRDGGLNWYEVKKGPHIYEIGDHGALIVMAPMNTVTDSVFFSWDEGKSWSTLKVAQQPFEVTNIIIEPESVSQEFVVYGVETLEDMMENDLDMDFSLEDEYEETGIIITLDFSQLHEPQCKGVESPGSAESDFELWTPFDGRHGKDKCFMGSKVSYVRRKRDSLCFNGEDLDREVRRTVCSCTEMDYECDAGFMRSEDTNTCTKIEGKDAYNHLSFQKDVQQAQCDSQSFYTISQGYRKVPGNHCTGGVSLDPVPVSCSYLSGGWFSLGNLLLVAGIAVLSYFGWTYIEAILLMLPIPDISGVFDKAKDMASSAKDKAMEMTGKSQGNQDYTQGFGTTPSSLEDGEEEDDDMEDIGKMPQTEAQSLDYDDEESSELIQIQSRSQAAAAKVPKLKKPL